MGYSQCTNCIDSSNFLKTGNPPTLKRSTSGRSDESYDHLKIQTNLLKMIVNFGLACLLPSCLIKHQILEDSKEEEEEEGSGQKGKKKSSSEHNKAWLLAESGGCGAAALTNGDELNSVHSSFRFSFCSQVEIDSLNINCSPSTTILMVNLDSNWAESRSGELKWKKIESLERTISPAANSLIRFSYDEILAATRNFSQGRVLGRGALSCVFRGRMGFLRSAVAVKRLDKEDAESHKAFCRELMIASSLQHPNIVPLLGFCIDSEEGLFLVYKYVSSGSLEHHLHDQIKGKKGFATLPWSVRYKVAIGVAESVAYLHNGTQRCVVHRDIKPSNILLSSKKRPKLCDFGLATWTAAPSVPFLCKTVKGTFGYLAPEYFQHGKVSDKTDVYAFGVVLLELLTGRKPIETNRPPGEENLVQWAKPLLDQGRASEVEKLRDPRGKLTPKSSEQISRMVRAASACLTSDESRRPGIIEAIALLRGDEQSCYVNQKMGSSSRYMANSYAQRQQMKNEITDHLALAMLGVSDLEDQHYLHNR
ncbi:hypothetical protein V2J09_013368 [Rumex salicifolius]